MQLTNDFLIAERACSDGLAWFTEHFGDAADYQAVLDRLAQENKCDWADWLLNAVGPIDAAMELTGEAAITGHLFVAGTLKCSASLSVSLSIKAGRGIEAGWGIKAGEGIEAGEDFGIYCGLRIKISTHATYAVVTAKTEPRNILTGTYRSINIDTDQK